MRLGSNSNALRVRPLRAIALGVWALAVVILIIGSLTAGENRGNPGAALITGYVLWLASWAALRVLTRGIADDSSARLDEWGLALRARSSRVGFVCFTCTAVLVAVYLLVADGDPGAAQRGGYLLLSTTLLSVSVPSASLALALPAGALDEEDTSDPESSVHHPSR